MDLESLRVFVPAAQEGTNGVPTVNMNLKSDQKVTIRSIQQLTNFDLNCQVLDFAPSNKAG